MPYVKGMLHEVDFKDFLTLCGTDTITDLWGMEPVSYTHLDVYKRQTVSRLRPISPLLLASTLVALKKMPLPMTMPTTMEMAVNRP